MRGSAGQITMAEWLFNELESLSVRRHQLERATKLRVFTECQIVSTTCFGVLLDSRRNGGGCR